MESYFTDSIYPETYFTLAYYAHLNIRSISNKFDSFENLLNSINKTFQIIGLTETWLNGMNNDNFKLQENDYIGLNRTN